MDDANKVNFYPTVDEILNEKPITECTECRHQFANASACRLHMLKQHAKTVSGENETKLVQRNIESPRLIMAFHCPDATCKAEEKWFDGLRNLKQHYYRTHTEKSFVCDMCGFKTGLEKDLNYHRKARCTWNKKQKDNKAPQEPSSGPRSKKRRNAKNTEPIQEASEPSTSASIPTPTHTVLQPIYFVVSPENVHSVIETVQKTLNSGGSVLDLVSAEASTQVQMPPFVDDVIYNTAPTSTSFATQYEEPVTFCERGTMMNGEEPLNYFSPPYGAEFGDMTPQEKNQPFDYSSTSSQQPQTRSFGTMFGNVTTCNTGTSMIDESSYDSEFLRDIETQTPNFLIQDPTSSATPGPSTTSNDWRWTRDI